MPGKASALNPVSEDDRGRKIWDRGEFSKMAEERLKRLAILSPLKTITNCLFGNSYPIIKKWAILYSLYRIKFPVSARSRRTKLILGPKNF